MGGTYSDSVHTMVCAFLTKHAPYSTDTAVTVCLSLCCGCGCMRCMCKDCLGCINSCAAGLGPDLQVQCNGGFDLLCRLLPSCMWCPLLKQCSNLGGHVCINRQQSLQLSVQLQPADAAAQQHQVRLLNLDWCIALRGSCKWRACSLLPCQKNEAIPEHDCSC